MFCIVWRNANPAHKRARRSRTIEIRPAIGKRSPKLFATPVWWATAWLGKSDSSRRIRQLHTPGAAAQTRTVSGAYVGRADRSYHEISSRNPPTRLVVGPGFRKASCGRIAVAFRFSGCGVLAGWKAFAVAQSTVSKYMARGGMPPSQTWKTFLRNHAEAIAAIDLCVVPTLTFDRLFAFLVLGHGRRQLLWFEVTRHPTAEWLARQITEAFPWVSAPAYLVRDNDGAYEPPRVRRRPFGLSHAAMAGCSSMA
jgi:hypothetical protein